MKKVHRVRVLAGVVLVLAGALATGVLASGAAAAGVSVTKSATPSDAIVCDGPIDVAVTVEETTTGLDIVLVLDVSGSVSTSSSAFEALKARASEAIEALDKSDGDDNNLIEGKQVGIVSYGGNISGGAKEAAALGSSYADLTTAANSNSTLGPVGGSSPHNVGIAKAVTLGAEAIILISDGQASGNAITDADGAKGTALLVSIGVGTENVGNLQNWASTNDLYQSGAAAIDQDELIADLGGTRFSLQETLDANFTSPGPLQLSGTLLGGEATLSYTATRDGSATQLGQVASETVSTTALTVNGAPATPPAPLTTLVLPCGATKLLDQETCTGGSCTGGGTTTAGLQYSVNAGAPAAGTELFVAALGSAPPTNVCPGFNANTNGVQFDIRPLTTAGTFEIRIPRTALGSKKWFQTDVCVGTNLRFITKIGSLAILRPGASNVDSRWWGLLPSIKRYTLVNGKLVAGPWITQRTVNAAGDAIIRFTMPYVTGSENVTTNGAAAYDPKVFGG